MERKHLTDTTIIQVVSATMKWTLNCDFLFFFSFLFLPALALWSLRENLLHRIRGIEGLCKKINKKEHTKKEEIITPTVTHITLLWAVN